MGFNPRQKRKVQLPVNPAENSELHHQAHGWVFVFIIEFWFFWSYDVKIQRIEVLEALFLHRIDID